jgi:hypothetical protein
VAISRASDSSIQDGLPKYNDIWDGTTATSSFDTLGSVFVPSGGLSSITFSNIPQTYQHLQIRSFITQGSGGTSGSDTFNTARFNGDTGSNYMSHALFADGSSTYSTATGTSQQLIWLGISSTSTTSSFNTNIIDILDYASSSKNKVVRGFFGHDRNGSGVVGFSSALWMNSSTGISSITIFATSGNFSINSQFALYGVK